MPMTFDHRASIVAFLEREAARFTAEADHAEVSGPPSRHLYTQANLARMWAAQIACGDDCAPTGATTSIAVASTTSPLPPLRTVGPMQNRGAQ